MSDTPPPTPTAASTSQRRRRRRAPPGSPPGTLVVDPTAARLTLRVLSYGPDEIEERDVVNIAELDRVRGTRPVTWVHVEGLSDIAAIRRLGEVFGLHELALEDVVHTHQRPKAEEYETHLFIVTRLAVPPGPQAVRGEEGVVTEQLSMFLGENFLITFLERSNPALAPVLARLRKNRGRIRSSGADYLAYALLDAVVDSYFPVVEAYGEAIESLEDEVVENPETNLVSRIHDMKRELLTLRRAIWPQREMLNTLIRDGAPLVSEPTSVFLRDCYDHTIQLMDMVETYREISFGLVDVYLSSVSTRMNEVMKVLTIIATIFIPLSFVAGVYGMNFDPAASPWNMPELGWYWGYPAVLGLMGLMAAGLLLYFRRKGWIGRKEPGHGKGR